MCIKSRFSKCFTIALISFAGLTACGGKSSGDKQSPLPSSTSKISSLMASSVSISSEAMSSSSISSEAMSSSSISSELVSSSSVSSEMLTSSSISSQTVSSLSSREAIIKTNVSGMVSLTNFNGDLLEFDDPETVKIKVSLLNEAGAEVAMQIPDAIEVNGDVQQYPFAASLEAADAKYIVLNISKPGYTDYMRRFDALSNLNVNAIMAKLPEEIIEASTAKSISGKSVTGFTFSVEGAVGEQVIVDGNNGSRSDLSISIPHSALPSDTATLQVTMQAFNPNNEAEAVYFPGAYEDSNGNKLLSVAFNYADIKAGGISLKRLAQKAQANRLALQKNLQKVSNVTEIQALEVTEVATDPVVINRTIPKESCLALSQMGDASSSIAGFQVPVYTYNATSGIWDLLGQGTLYSDKGEVISSNQTNFDCSENSYVLEILATNEIFISNWWNLDYPLTFTQPLPLCARVEVINEKGVAVPGATFFLNDDDDERSFSAESFVTDALGRATIKVYSLDSGKDVSAQVAIYDSYLDQGKSIAKVTLSNQCTSSTPLVTIPIKLPELCSVSGRVVDPAGEPIGDTVVIGASDFSSDAGYFNLKQPLVAITDAQGIYNLKAVCEEKYQVVEWSSWIIENLFEPKEFTSNYAFNVNGIADLYEDTDSGSASVLKNIVIDPTRPLVIASNIEDDSELGFANNKIQLAFYYSGKDFPLTYSFDISEETDKGEINISHFEGTLNSGEVAPSSAAFTAVAIREVHTQLQLGDIPKFYRVRGDVTDAKGIKGRIVGYFLLGPIENLSKDD